MPIRAENRARCPADWPEIRARMLERAAGRCECVGECGRDHRAVFFGRDLATGEELHAETDRCAALNGLPHPRTHSKVVLTVHHRDHRPENSDDEANLVALCQDCHLAIHRRDGPTAAAPPKETL